MLTQRLQVQTIANYLAGIPGGFKLNDFEEPWRTAYRVITQTPPESRQQALLSALEDNPDRNSLIGIILAQMPGEAKQTFPALQEIASTLTPVEWLWTNWIPRGMLSLFGAMPGAGKSLVALDLARRIIAGETFPDGSPVLLKVSDAPRVVYVDAEGIPQLHNKRAEEWQMDRNRIYLMLPPPRGMIDFLQQPSQDLLIEMAFSIRPEMIIIDSLSSVNSKGENSVEDVRGILGFLSALAADYQCGLLLIHHLRKRNPLQIVDMLDIDDFRGSSHIIAMSRSVLALSVIQTGPEKDRNGPRKLEIVKSNLVPCPPSLGVEFAPLHPAGVSLRYGEPPSPYKETSGQDQCAEWLVQTLEENGPLQRKDIIAMAEEAGYSVHMVARARESLGTRIRDTMGKKSPKNQWALNEEDGE